MYQNSVKDQLECTQKPALAKISDRLLQIFTKEKTRTGRNLPKKRQGNDNFNL